MTPQFPRALTYAWRLHRHQVRKGTRIPYLSHLLATAALVLEDGGTEDQAIAAVLHDAVEDAGGYRTLRQIRRRFGPRVARIVEGCTDANTVPKPPWRQRKEEHIRKLETAPRAVLFVSAGDKLANARSLLSDYRRHGKKVWRRFNAGKAEQLWYYGRLARLFRTCLPDSTSTRELSRVVAELRRVSHRGRQ